MIEAAVPDGIEVSCTVSVRVGKDNMDLIKVVLFIYKWTKIRLSIK